MTTQTLALEDIIRLIDDLRSAGYDVGTQQYINVQRLLLSIAAHGRHPARLSDLRSLLAPVLCSSSKEQEHFYEYFPRWLARQPHLAPGNSVTTSKTAVRRAGPTKPPPGSTQRRLGWHTPLVAFTALSAALVYLLLFIFASVLFVTVVYLLLLPRPRTLDGVVVSADEGNAPVSGARLTLVRQPADDIMVVTNDDGKFTFTYSGQDVPVSLIVEHSEYPQQTLDVSNAQSPVTITLRRPSSGPALNPTPPAGNLTAQAGLRYEQIRLVASALPLLLFAVWWLSRLYRHRRMLLRKGRSTRLPRLEHLIVKGAAEQLFRGQAFRHTEQELRRHRRYVSHDLDEEITIEATIRRGGLFTPFYGSRRTLPEYLALIDRVSPRDQQACFQEELVRRLTQDNIIVDQYYFRGDPRICHRKDDYTGHVAAHIRLPDLAALYPNSYLLIFSDGAGFINPVTGDPESWLEQFTQWEGRAILTPESPAHWRAREWALQELDFLVLPGGKDGLAALGEAINTGILPNPSRRPSGPFPELLREHPRLWLEEHEPPPAKVSRLFGQLAAYLGADGMDWLAACAVYPALHWDLTLYLGFELTADREEFERKLLALVSLPWLRYGTMPDWLRMRLISTLTPDAERIIRRLLERLLITTLDPPPDGVRLDYAVEQEEVTPRGIQRLGRHLRNMVRTGKRRSALREHFRTETDDSLLQDFVFLTFMSGRRPSRLDVSVPDLLQHVLFPRGLRPNGLRPVTALVCALLLSFGGWFMVSALGTVVSVLGTNLKMPSFTKTANISSLKIVKDVNATQESSTFGPDERVYAIAVISDASRALQVTGHLAIEDVGGEQPGPIPGVEKALDLPGDSTATYTFSPPTAGWPAGKYRVDVLMNEEGGRKDQKSAIFTVLAKPSPTPTPNAYPPSTPLPTSNGNFTR